MLEARQPFVAGNWKCNTTLDSAVRLTDDLKRRVSRLRRIQVGVVPPFPFLDRVASRLKGERIAVGAQDVHTGPSGAYTGAVSASMLKSVGVDFVLIGHSERRHVFGDTLETVAAKLQAALDAELDIVLCVGERLEERDAGQAVAVCESQLSSALENVSSDTMERVTIAYEPVWAIGTGRVATPEQAQSIHQQIRTWLGHRFDSDVAASTRIQYGGSVKPANAAGLMTQPDVDGALVGGASLDADSFSAIVSASLESSAEINSVRNSKT